MIKVIAGAKGTGKTAQLVDDINDQSNQDNNNIVCIQRGDRLNRLLKYKIRLIDIDSYPVIGFDQLLSFIAGIYAKDFDLTHIYIDSIFKVTRDEDIDAFSAFLDKLDVFASENDIVVTIVYSSDSVNLSDKIRKYS